GGARDEVTAHDPAAPNKAFVAIGGRALVQRTIDALRASASIEHIIVVAPRAAFDHPALAGCDDLRESGPAIQDSLRAGIDGLPPESPVVIAASDLPVLSAAAVDDFVARAAG